MRLGKGKIFTQQKRGERRPDDRGSDVKSDGSKILSGTDGVVLHPPISKGRMRRKRPYWASLSASGFFVTMIGLERRVGRNQT